MVTKESPNVRVPKQIRNFVKSSLLASSNIILREIKDNMNEVAKAIETFIVPNSSMLARKPKPITSSTIAIP